MKKLGGIRLHDYRCFRRETPATLELTTGFTGFLGPNNAGKSALIRCAYELRNTFTHVLALLDGASGVNQELHSFTFLPPMHDHAEIVAERDDPKCEVEIFGVPITAGIAQITAVRLMFQADGQVFRVRMHTSIGTSIDIGNAEDSVTIDQRDVIFLPKRNVRYSTLEIKRLLRTLIGIQFIGAFRNAVNEGSGSYFDIHLGTGFISQWHTWKTGPLRAQNRAIQRVTDDVRRLLGARDLEITAATELRTLQVTLNGRPQKLQELGAGIAQLIVVLGNTLIKKPTFVAIDEPEIHLHPGLQTEFLTALGSYATNGVMFTSHSIGLARSVADRLFTVRPTAQGSQVRPFEKTPHYAEFLGSMGIAGLQEFGWDRILLVEGAKDVRTIQAWLRLYGKDRQTVIIPLGGDSMVNGKTASELSEIVRLGGSVWAIVDSERSSAKAEPIKARREFAQNCESLQVRCLVTERRAIENYLSGPALRTAFGEGFEALSPFEVPNAEKFWGKGESWKAARHMTKEELADTDIGRFLETL